MSRIIDPTIEVAVPEGFTHEELSELQDFCANHLVTDQRYALLVKFVDLRVKQEARALMHAGFPSDQVNHKRGYLLGLEEAANVPFLLAETYNNSSTDGDTQ